MMAALSPRAPAQPRVSAQMLYRLPESLTEVAIQLLLAGRRSGLDYVRTGLVGVNDCNCRGTTPILAACYALQLPLVRDLLRLGADPTVRGRITANCTDAVALGGSDYREGRVLSGIDPALCDPVFRRSAKIMHLLLEAGGAPHDAIGNDVDTVYLTRLRASAQKRGYAIVVRELNRVLHQ
jgi:hypothetical protein